MSVKQIIVTILMVAPLFLLAQSDSTMQKSNYSARTQRAMARREHINKLIAEEDEGALVFNKQWALGIKLNTDGYSFFYEHGKYKTIKRTNLWWIEFGEKKQHNQQKVTPQPTVDIYPGFEIVSVGSDFVYGKENNFYQLKVGFGRQLLIGGKGTTNGVAVSAIFGGGVSLGILKPYYLQVLDSSSATEVADIKYTDNPTEFLDPNSIVGASSFSKGLSELTFVPGLHARGSLRFDYGKYRLTLSALEVGVNADFYTQKITIMAQNPNHNLFVDAYVAIDFGGRK
jgi:hypothetical protein